LSRVKLASVEQVGTLPTTISARYCFVAPCMRPIRRPGATCSALSTA
jgi:hypothetical protein